MKKSVKKAVKKSGSVVLKIKGIGARSKPVMEIYPNLIKEAVFGIRNGFDWKYTEEGDEYWYGVIEKLERINHMKSGADYKVVRYE